MKDTRDMMVKDYDTCTDEELIARLRAGEREITDYLIDKYKSLVRTRARALYLVGGDHEDLIQEGMLGLFKAVRDYKPGKEASFATFAGLCIDRQMYSAVASSQRQKHQPLNSFVSLSEPVSEQELRLVDEETPEEIMISRENVIGMHERIKERLSKFEYQVLELYLKGYDYTQIAEKLGKNVRQVILRWNIQRGNCVIPKSSKPHRIADNFNIFDFELDADDMAVIGTMENGNSYCSDSSVFTGDFWNIEDHLLNRE